MGDVRILVVQPSELDPPQRLGEWLVAAGAELDVVVATREQLPSELDGYSALVVLGGEMGALDDAHYPWLSDVRLLLSQAVGRRIPVLGVCLGAQLLAVATGGQVRQAQGGPEVGTLLIAKRDRAGEDLLLGPLPLTPDVLQFHRDEVTTLPPSAQLLASSPKCDNQAFRVGETAYGLQFHVETTTETVLDWVRQMPETAGFAREGQLSRQHLDSFHEDLVETWQPMVERFVGVASQPPDQRSSRRQLPLV